MKIGNGKIKLRYPMENIFEKRKIKNWQMKFGKLKKIF